MAISIDDKVVRVTNEGGTLLTPPPDNGKTFAVKNITWEDLVASNEVKITWSDPNAQPGFTVLTISYRSELWLAGNDFGDPDNHTETSSSREAIFPAFTRPYILKIISTLNGDVLSFTIIEDVVKLAPIIPVIAQPASGAGGRPNDELPKRRKGIFKTLFAFLGKIFRR